MNAAPPAATAAAAAQNTAAHPSLISGGAWEAIVDKAVTQVTEYLTTTTREFDPAAPLSGHMLHLLDRSTLRDIVVERNYNELCGCLGCGNKPRGLLWEMEKGTAGTLSFDWFSSSSSSAASSCTSSAAESESDGELEGGKDKQQSLDQQQRRQEKKKKSSSCADAASRKQRRGKDHSDTGPTANDEEIVYEDDLYTAESFQLVQRQRAQLNRLQRKKSLSKDGGVLDAGNAVAAPRVRQSGMLGVSFPHRFCSVECAELYTSGISPRVSPYRAMDYPVVFSAITNLFPNLSVASLQQLAGAEVSASWLVRPIQEKSEITTSNSSSSSTTKNPIDATTATAPAASTEDQNSLKPVQVGVSYESTEHLKQRKSTKKDSLRDQPNARGCVEGAAMKQGDHPSQQQQQQLRLRTVLEQMHVLESVWNHEVVPRFSEMRLPRVPLPATEAAVSTAAAKISHNSTCADTKSRTETAITNGNVDPTRNQEQLLAAGAPRITSINATTVTHHSRPALRGSLLLFDFIMNTSGVRTQRLFLTHYAKHRAALQENVAAVKSRTTAAGAPGATFRQNCTASFFAKVSSQVVAALEERYKSANANEVVAEATAQQEVEEGLHIDPVLQHQRRELLTTYLFSEEVTASLSRLLMVDYLLLLKSAWTGVWFKELPLNNAGGNSQKETCSLLRSLLFPFAIPAVLLRAAGSSPEVTGLAMIYLIAAGCCSEVVWAGCMTEDAAFDEVAEVVGLTEADTIAAVCSLMLGEEE